MKMPRFHRLAITAALLGAGSFGLSAVPAHASAAAAVGTCGGAVLAQLNPNTGDWAAAPAGWECTDSGSGRMGAYGSFSGTSFSRTHYDNFCSGTGHGNKVADELVGFVNVTCGGVSRSGPFSLTVVDLVGTMSVTR